MLSVLKIHNTEWERERKWAPSKGHKETFGSSGQVSYHLYGVHLSKRSKLHIFKGGGAFIVDVILSLISYISTFQVFNKSFKK